MNNKAETVIDTTRGRVRQVEELDVLHVMIYMWSSTVRKRNQQACTRRKVCENEK